MWPKILCANMIMRLRSDPKCRLFFAVPYSGTSPAKPRALQCFWLPIFLRNSLSAFLAWLTSIVHLKCFVKGFKQNKVIYFIIALIRAISMLIFDMFYWHYSLKIFSIFHQKIVFITKNIIHTKICPIYGVIIIMPRKIVCSYWQNYKYLLNYFEKLVFSQSKKCHLNTSNKLPEFTLTASTDERGWSYG